MDIVGYMKDPNHCPNCQSDNFNVERELYIDEEDDGSTWVKSELSCDDCKLEWTDKYKFMSFEVTKQPNRGEEEDEEKSEDEDEEESEEDENS